MFLLIAIILLILWASGHVAFHIAGGLWDLLLILVIVAAVYGFVVRGPRV